MLIRGIIKTVMKNFIDSGPSLYAYKTGERAIASLAEAVDDYNLFGAAKRAVPFAMLDYPLRFHSANARQGHQLFGPGSINVHTLRASIAALSISV